MDYLNDLEIEKVAAFYKDEVMREAVRKVLLAGIYYNGTLVPGVAANPAQNFVLQYAFLVEMQNVPVSDAELGSDVRAEVKAIRKVEQAFGELAKATPPVPTKPKQEKPNKAK